MKNPLRVLSASALGFGLMLSILVPLSFAMAQASPNVSIQSLSPGASVPSGTEVSFLVSASGFSSSLSYSVSDSFSNSSVSSGNINSSGVFSWIPTSSDVGAHLVTITVTDQSGNSASVTQGITVSGPPGVTIQSLSPGSTDTVGNPVFFTAASSGFTNPSYSVTDSFGGSSLTTAAINSSGGFSWTPIAQDAGTHTITVSVTDAYSDSANVSQTITINPSASASIESLSPGATVSSSQNVTFTVGTAGFTNPTYAVSDSFSSSSISNANINSSGVFSWTPSVSDIGTHTITVTVSDSSGNNATVSQVITVAGAGLSIQSITPSTTLNAGTTLSFTVVPSSFTNPTYTVSDPLYGSSVSSADLATSTGVFTWTPTSGDIGTHIITISATDASGRSANTEVTIDVQSSGTVSSGLNQSQIQSILSLLQSFGVDQSTIANVSAILNGQPATGSSASPSYTFTSYLYQGLTSNQVTDLQKILTSQGFYSGPITGYFGSLTKAAVIKFQAAHNIEQSGAIGPLTRVALNG